MPILYMSTNYAIVNCQPSFFDALGVTKSSKGLARSKKTTKLFFLQPLNKAVLRVCLMMMHRLSFEDDGSTLVAATQNGISVWDCKTGSKLDANSYPCGPLGVASKILTLSALVGKVESKAAISTTTAAATTSSTSSSSSTGEVTLSPTKILIYNHGSKKLLGELTTRMPILSVKMQKDKIFVVLEDSTYCYDLYNLAKITQIETTANVLGLCEISRVPIGTMGTTYGTIVVTPGTQAGYIKITRLSASPVSSSPQLRAANAASIAAIGKPLTAKETAMLIGSSKSDVVGTPSLINAHKSELSALAINRSGTRVASASKDGTIIRVFDITAGTAGKKIQELRRGRNPVKIQSLAFNKSGDHLLCSSDAGTVHLWNIFNCTAETKRSSVATETKVAATTSNRTSYFSFASAVLPEHFSSEWSFCQYRHEPLPVKPAVADKRCVACFADEDKLMYVAGYDGSLTVVKYSMDGTTEIVRREHISGET
jgi:WD40 repeat protein